MEIATKKQQKEKGLECLKRLKVYDGTIEDFKEDIVYYFSDYEADLASEDKDITAKIKELEETFSLKVYAVIVTESKNGKLYDFLYISQYYEEFSHTLLNTGESNMFLASSYCWSRDDSISSEFCSRVIITELGYLRRCN